MSAQLNETTFESLGAVSVAAETGGRVIETRTTSAGASAAWSGSPRAYYLLGFEPAETSMPTAPSAD